MRKFSRILSVVLTVMILFSFSACKGANDVSSDNNGDVVMSFEGVNISEKEYMYIASYIKHMIVSEQINYYYQYYGVQYDEADILAMEISEGVTIADYIEDFAIEFTQQMIIIEKYCSDSELVISEEDISTVESEIADIEYNYGGEDLFEIALEKQGFSRSGIERFHRYSALYDLLYNYRYGENGMARVSSESVNKYFTENYLSYDGVYYSYVDSEGKSIDFGFSDEEVAAYYKDNYVKVRHVLYLTVDSSNKPLADEVIAEKKSKAEAAYKSVIDGSKSFTDYASDNEDSGSEYLFTYGEMVEAFETASFEMEIGEVRLVETEYGYHLIQKLEKTDEDLNGIVGEDGKTSGGIKSEVVGDMSAKKICEEASDVLKKLNSGELTAYPEESSDNEYYTVMDSAFFNKTDSNYSALVEVIGDIEPGTYVEKEFSGQGYYIMRSIPFTEKDITSDIYSTIEEELAVESFAEYIQSSYDSVQINEEVLNRFDILQLPLLEEEFYS